MTAVRYKPRDPLAVGCSRLEVTCWCEARVIEVSAELIRVGRTGSCGAEGCTPTP